MKQRIGQLTGHESARYIGLGVVAGLLVLTIALIWRGTRDETIVLEVQRFTDSDSLRVYVGGEVHAPGLYTLERGSRVAEAIAAAGGVTENGDTSGLGMAAPLRDADQIIVASLRVAGSQTAVGDSPRTDSQAVGVVNINMADATELEKLPGIGPAIAGRIVEYRTRHGFFRSVDELEAVQGISLRMVDDLRPLVTTGP